MLLRICLILVVCLIGQTAFRAQAPVCADSNSQRNCCGVTRVEDCPEQGCGGDPELNRRKNRTSKPAAADVESKTLLEIANFTSPASWSSGTSRTLLETWGEGRAVQVTAYLIKAENYTDGSETTNCNLRTNDFNDFHLVLVQNPTAAKRAVARMETNPTAGKKAFKRAEKKSLTAEITPRLRPDGWTIAKLRQLARDFAYVRVTGWAMLDTQHISRPIHRLSNWEIHPVTKFEVCTTTVTACDTGTGWTILEDIP